MSPQPVLGMFLSAAFRYILSLFTLCLSQKRPASPSPRASGPMGETPPRTDPPKSALQVARPRALSPGLSATGRRPSTAAVQRNGHDLAPLNPRQGEGSLAAPPRGFAPSSTPSSRPKSFLENTLTRLSNQTRFDHPIHASRKSFSPQPHPWQTGVSRNFWHPCCTAFVLTACDATHPPRTFMSSPPPPSARPSPKPPTPSSTPIPDVRVVSNFAGSQVLRLQIESGARADLFVSANPDHLDALQRAGTAIRAPNRRGYQCPRAGGTRRQPRWRDRHSKTCHNPAAA